MLGLVLVGTCYMSVLPLRELELVQKLRPMQLQPRVLREHLKFKKRRLRNQYPRSLAAPATTATLVDQDPLSTWAYRRWLGKSDL